MPRPSRPWLRWYVETIYDLKLRSRPPAERWVWVAILTIARQSTEAGTLRIGSRPATTDDIADAAKVTSEMVVTAVEYFTSNDAAMLGRSEDGALVVLNWRDRQFESDDVARRTAKHRSAASGRNDVGTSKERSKDRSNDVPGNEIGTDQIQSHIQIPTTRAHSAAPDPYADDFEKVWAKYPRKINRKGAERAYVARRRAGVSANDLLRATENFAAAMIREGRAANVVMHASTFYGRDERYVDYLTAPPAEVDPDPVEVEPSW